MIGATGSFTEELSATAERFCRRFSLAEIQSATQGFSEEHLIGNGGFGKVYKGQIDYGEESVAIKRLATNSNQGAHEFLTEIETLSKLRHINLVSLIGYCSENGEMILVYEYIPRGTLADNLYKPTSSDSDSDDYYSVLTWKQRLNICTGAARGLDYLHTGTSIIHRDVKSTNILLDDNFRAKVSDFGLAKHLSAINPRSHVSTLVKGSFGYLDPSYFTTGRLTRQSDTYAFGVVLLEVLCGRPAVDPSRGEDEMSLVVWAQEKISKGKADQIVASNLREEIAADCLKTFVGIAKKCLNLEQKKRPTMAEVVSRLQSALEQQERKEQTLNVSWFLPFWNRGNRATGSSEDHKQVVPAIPLTQLQNITSNFSSKCLISGGSRGSSVYRGAVKRGQIVAIKKLSSSLTDKEFLEQVSIMFSLKHENVAPLLGYCVDTSMYGSRQYLAYEFAHNGSLQDILHGQPDADGSKAVPALSWTQRVKIAIGVAKGLEYIHQKALIHSNIRCSNILFFDNYEVPKLADFGPSTKSTYPLPTDGSVDYHPPEYVWSGEVSWRSDVYSFGVVLLELLTGREVFSKGWPRGQQHIVEWATLWLDKDDVIVDPKLNGRYTTEAAAKMAGVAAMCVQHEAKRRPDMSVVVRALRPLLNATSAVEHL